MKIFSWIIKDTSIDFLGYRKLAYALSAVLFAASIASVAVRGFNYGIDFSGGVLIEVKSKTGPVDVDKVRSELDTLKLDELNLQSFGDAQDELMIRAQANNADEESQRVAIKQIKEMLENDFTFERIESVGPQVGDELKLSGILASVFAMLAISLYIWFRFEWKFAVGALVGLFHDLLITIGLVSIFHLDFSLTTIAAILTLAGYSVNDTVVTYDRVRENLQKYKKMSQYDLLNKSINDIFSRTILTGVTTFLASSALLIFGGDALRSFAFVITSGIIIGTFSSIFICVPVINMFDLRATPDEKDVNPFGNVQ
ncbi:MAG: protein translocase subunit SecF [Alphaproteobacteria bacterium]|nr:protein translocase subunit SecF [Alphaproteobacteria bacterium]MDY4690131.1 protein translocase subunit SecF [Alphaproteobacteria bacterium]